MVTVDTPVPLIPDLIPARMLNEFAFCPRLAHVEWVQGQFAPNAETLGGNYRHRAVNRPGGGDPPDANASPTDPDAPEATTPDAPDADSDLTFRTRSLHISAPQLDLTAAPRIRSRGCPRTPSVVPESGNAPTSPASPFPSSTTLSPDSATTVSPTSSYHINPPAQDTHLPGTSPSPWRSQPQLWSRGTDPLLTTAIPSRHG